MSTPPRSPSPDKSLLLLDFPVRLYTALRTMRLYPAANPQVQRSNDFVLKAFNALLASGTDDSVNLAISELKILVCGEHLADRDQGRPQIQGLITLLNRLKIHSFSFHPSFDFTQCEIFIQSLADLLGEKELSEPLADLFTRAGLHSVSVDAKRYVAVHKGEQVVRDELIGAGLNISDEELANFVLGKSGPNAHPRAIDTELIEELISRLPKSAGDQEQSTGLSETVLDLLEKLSREIDFGRRTEGINQSATALTNLDPALLASLVAEMPATAVADEMLDLVLDRLSPAQRNTLIANLVARLPVETAAGTRDEQRQTGIDVLERLAGLQGQNGALQQIIAQNIDAHVLQAPLEQGAALPELLVMRLQQPAWSAPVLVTAAQQSLDPANYKDGKADFSPFKRMLAKYDSLLNKEKQLQVAAQAGAELATFDEQDLGLILVQKYRSLFGDQLYQQVINQLSDEKFAHLANQLQALSHNHEGIPLDDEDQDIEEAYTRLLHTVRGEKMRAILAMHRDQQDTREEKKQGVIRNRLDQLLQGELKCLKEEEVRRTLPDTMATLFDEGREDAVDTLLMQLAVALQNQAAPTRTHAGLTLAGIAEKLADAGQWQRLEKLLPALDQAIQSPDMDERGVEKILTAVRRLASHYLGEEHFDRAVATILFLRNLATEEQPGSSRNPLVRNQALSTLNNLSTKSVLERLLDRYLHSEPLREAAGQILTELGVESAKFQLQQLMNNESRFERKRLLTLIKQTGNPAVSILLEQLNKTSPWFVVRNIIRLLGEIGKPELFPVVRPFITHADLRVQQEVINTAVKFGGEHLKDFLFQALSSVDDSLQVKVVTHVATAHDERFVRPLTDLLESAKPFLGKDKNHLHMTICKTLGAIGSKRATASLHRVVQSKTVLGLGGHSDEVRQAAGMALEEIRDKTAVKIPATDMEYETDGTDDHPHGTGTAIPDHRTREEDIFALVAHGNRDQAKKDLLELIGVTARAGDFQTAERLRERIYEIDSLALGEIIRSGEIIEEEKRGAIKEEDLEIWAGLTDRLTTEEFQNIYHEFSEQRFKPEEVLVSQGDRNDTLFFINQGSIKVSHMVGSRELFITSLNRGQIAGENFFTPSFWTVSLTSLTPSRVYILRQETLNAWQERFPGLRAKLHDFYRACNNIRSMLEKKGLERRRDQRFDLSRKIQVQPINSLDTPVGRGFRAETADISQGGLGFLIRISRQENARLLLGRRMQVVLPVGGKTKYLYLKGLVIGVQPFHILENDFSVHFKFDQPMDQQGLQMVLG